MTELILQLAALALAAVLASIGITQEYRHKNRKVTKWGMIAVLGAVLTFMFSVALQVLQTAHNDKEKRLRDAATQQQLNEIRRAVCGRLGCARRSRLPTLSQLMVVLPTGSDRCAREGVATQRRTTCGPGFRGSDTSRARCRV
jgi:hypothetical protein